MSFDNAISALQAPETSKPDLILTDYQMPRAIMAFQNDAFSRKCFNYKQFLQRRLPSQ